MPWMTQLLKHTCHLQQDISFPCVEQPVLVQSEYKVEEYPSGQVRFISVSSFDSDVIYVYKKLM